MVIKKIPFNVLKVFFFAIDESWPEFGILDGLLEGEAAWVEGNQAVADGPLLHRLLHNIRIRFFRDNSTEEMDHKKQKLAVCSSVPLAKKVKYSRGGEGTRIRAASEQT